MRGLGALTLAALLIGRPMDAQAQAHQHVCSVAEDPGISLAIVPTRPPRIVVGCGDAYALAHVERGAAGPFAVGEATLRWGGATAGQWQRTMPIVAADTSGGDGVDLNLGFAQFSPHGGGRGGAVITMPLVDGGVGRARRLFAGLPQGLLATDVNQDGHAELLVVEYGEPWAGHSAAVGIYEGGRRTRRIADLVMAPVASALAGSGPTAQIVIASERFESASHTSEPSIAVAPLTSGETPWVAPVPRQHWARAFADFDADGRLDFAFAGRDGVVITEQTFGRERWVTRGQAQRLFLIDPDGRGRQQLAYCLESRLYVATCEPRGCPAMPWLATDCETLRAIAVGDVDGDGQREMVIAHEIEGADSSHGEVWLTFVSARAMRAPSAPTIVDVPFTPGPTTTVR